jgi:predicted metalloprotease with PDZ domain
LFQRAGFILRKRSEDGWIGLAERGRGIATVSGEGTIASLVAWGTPAFEAGLDQGDVVVDVDGKSFASGALSAALKAHKPGDTISITYKRRNGATGTTKVTVKPDPDFDVVAIETTGGALTPEQKAFREAWLGSKVRN